MDIFGALLNGASLHPMDVKEEDPSDLFRQLAREKITIYHSTPTVYRYLMKALPGGTDLSKIRFVVLGGEEVHRDDIDLFKRNFSSRSIFVNGLGPSESTVTLQYFINHETEISGDIVPVGYPVEDTEILLLNKSGKRGEVYGEIGIRSAHVALGYWRKPELTEAAFLHDAQDGAKRIYRSGDLGRLLPDGAIAFVGRKDFQVKIRGFRIELGEIESALAGHPAVREAVVVVREDELKDKRLLAYVVPEEKHAGAAIELRGFLKAKMPEYMIPSAVILIDALPLTPNGKVDTRGLPGPDVSVELQEAFVPPRTFVEEVLARIWSEVLSTDKVGVRHNFFELGGHSLLATKVMSRIPDSFQVKLALRTLFEKPTIEELAAAIIEKQAEEIQQEQQVARLLAELESLSDEDTKRQLLEQQK
jgi:acyl-coenzyme A synthetase/AMP-(fatty) acid ligase